jgi:hypothetical protein
MKSIIRGLTKLSIIAAAIFLFHGSVHAVDITLGWQKNTETDLSGYKIYYAKSSFDNGTKPSQPEEVTLLDLEDPQAYDETDDTAIYTITLPDLDEDEVYYLAISAYNQSDLESPISATINTRDDGPGSGESSGSGGGSEGGCFLRMMVVAQLIQ